MFYLFLTKTIQEHEKVYKKQANELVAPSSFIILGIHCINYWNILPAYISDHAIMPNNKS